MTRFESSVRPVTKTAFRAESARRYVPWVACLLLFAGGAWGCGRGDDGGENSSGSDAATSDERAAGRLIARADDLYARRADLVEVRRGAAQLRAALAEDYRSYDAAWRMAKVSFYLGSHTEDRAERERAFRDGIEAGKKAVALRDDLPDGHFWLGANYGGSAQAGALAGLAAIEDIKREMEAVLRIDRAYQGASAYMALGRVYLEAPKMFGGDAERAVELMEEGLRSGGENNALLRWRLAEAYAAIKRTDDARRQIDFIAAMKPPPDYLPEYEEALSGAKRLSATLAK